jgi:hypothetical protein
LLLQLEVVHAGVSKLLANSSEPCSHPEKKMTKMLNKQQAAAYLAAPAANGADSSMPSDAKQQQQPLHLSELRDPRQLQLLHESEECCSSSAASSAYEQQAAAGNSSSSNPHQPQQGVFPLVPQRVRAVSYGGVLPNAHAHELPAGSSCSDPGVGPSHDGSTSAAAASSRIASSRRSLAVQTGGAGSDDAACYPEGDSSDYNCQVPSSLSSPARLLAGSSGSYSSGGVPAAVAVIEIGGGAPALAMQQLENGAVKLPVVASAAAGATAGGLNGSRDGAVRGFSTLEDLATC